MGHTTEQSRTLGALIEERRASLNLTVSAAAKRAGVTRQTWHQIENGGRASMLPETMSRIDRALGWDEGTVRGLINDMRPTTNDPVTAARRKVIAHVTNLDAEKLDLVLRYIEAGFQNRPDKAYIDEAIEAKFRELLDATTKR